MPDKKYILTKEIAEKKLRRMALEICERNYNESELLLIGIKENGITVAEKIGNYIGGIFKGKVTVHSLSIDKKTPYIPKIAPDAHALIVRSCHQRLVMLAISPVKKYATANLNFPR